MPLHLIKLAVGAEDVDDMVAWANRRAIVHTRHTPKRAAELLEDAGSLYWVVKGQVLVRQRVVKVDTVGEGQGSRCEIRLAREIVLTAPQPKRPFQGWRYLRHEDAPPDLTDVGGEHVPTELATQLRTIGAW